MTPTPEPSAPSLLAEGDQLSASLEADGCPLAARVVDDLVREVRLLLASETLVCHSVAYYLIDTIADPVERQRVAAQRFGKRFAALTATLTTDEAASHPHPTRTVTARVSCVWTDGTEYEITLTDADHRDWRFQVADAEPYPVGSMITLEVPA